ncbi:TVP38/TMEM64 family protein [Enterocloster lavalensis]|uniref:TVP38/TMEM64 family protein n=1 Tax=Enterocloster lavalensis TaxID=460384 RepID=UPI0026656F41|nr:VTT domain-containing protein [Enterocloster lavalensis]
MFCTVFILKAGVDGRFHSVDTLQEYIRSFGLIGPMILIAIQAFQVVIPVLPGFLGCIVGVVLFGTAGGFWCNYIGISLGSLIAFILARRFGAPLVESLFSQEHYQVWIKRIQSAKSYTLILFLCILLPLAPDDFLCYFFRAYEAVFSEIHLDHPVGKTLVHSGLQHFSRKNRIKRGQDQYAWIL